MKHCLINASEALFWVYFRQVHTLVYNNHHKSVDKQEVPVCYFDVETYDCNACIAENVYPVAATNFSLEPNRFTHV